MKRLPLINSRRVALIDDEDYERASQLTWRVMKHGYAAHQTMTKERVNICILLHRFIMNARGRGGIDHANGNKLDNRKCNLRFCNQSQNGYNSIKKAAAKSKFKGVCRKDEIPRNKPWFAYIGTGKDRIYLGMFKTDVEAAVAYNHAAIKMAGEFARLNTI